MKWLLTALLTIVTAWTQPSQAAIPFTYTTNLLTEDKYSRAVAAADFNRDGILDLVVTGFGDFGNQGSISVFRGNGDGTFAPRVTYALPGNANAVDAADVNSDTYPDLAVGTGFNYMLMLGNGDGSFAAPTELEPQGTTFISFADLNTDGHPDIVASTASSVRIRLGNGDGTFGPTIAIAFPCVYGEVLHGDFNNDGRVDLAVIHCPDVVSILLGNGDGTFQTPVDYRVTRGPNAGDVGDLNSDGRLDLAIANQHSDNVSVLMGNGDGTFSPGATIATGVAPIEAALGDLNSDQIPDLAVATYFGSTLEVFEGRGDGTFEPKIGYATGLVPSVTFGDWDRDGLLDIAASNLGGALPASRISLFRNTPGVLVGASPVVTAPSTVTGTVGSMIVFDVTAADPDGDAIPSLRALQLPANVEPAGATFTPNTANTSGTFRWTPDSSAGGRSFDFAFVAQNALSASVRTSIFVSNASNQPPVLGAIGNKTVDAGTTLTFTASATDADVPPNVLAFSLDPGAPVGATIVGSTGTFSWTPSFVQIGTFPITVRVTDNGSPALSDFETITVQVNVVDGHPTANAGGPYTGIVNVPVNFDGTGSSDPTGQALTYAWTFGDGSKGTGPTPAHTYTAPGNYVVTLRVTDPDGNYGDATTTVTILDEIPVTLLLKNGRSTINMGDDILKLGIEESEQPYANVLVGTLRLSTDFPNAGTVAECAADSKHMRIGDLDRNGVPDLELRFPIACVRNLFRNTPNNSTVNLILTGQFETSTGMVPLRGVKAVTIKRGGGGSAPVLAYPNPFNPQGRLSFVTTRGGGASIQLFDLQGRLVRTLLPQQFLGAGVHEVTIDGLSDQGVSLSSGVYYYRVSTPDGVTEGSISVLK